MENKIKQFGAFIHEDAKYVGSGIIFKNESELYLITAGHNFYGNEYDKDPKIEEFTVVDYLGDTHKISEIYGSRSDSVKTDIISLRLKCSSTLSNFQIPIFSTMPQNPAHSLMFWGRNNSSTNNVLHRKLYYNNVGTHPSHFHCKIDKELLRNYQGKSGALWLGGWSGSGLFYEHGSKVIVCGILLEIPNKGDDGQLLFSSFSGLSFSLFMPELLDTSKLDFDEAFQAESLRDILLQTTSETIAQWENDEKESYEVKNLNRKVNNVYEDDVFLDQKRRIAKALMVGRAYIATELKLQDYLYNIYERSNSSFDLTDMNFVVKDKNDALIQLKEITKEYKNLLTNSLNGKLHQDDINVLIQNGISEWIVKCTINFIQA